MSFDFSHSDGCWTISGPIRPSYITGFEGNGRRIQELAEFGEDPWASKFDFDRYHDADDHLAYIQEALVAASYRGRGIGTRLSMNLFDRLELLGVIAVHLKALDTSIRFWNRLGFEIAEQDGLGAHMFRTI